jgi:hypothetical protein
MNIFDRWERWFASELHKSLSRVLGAENLPDSVELFQKLVEDLSHDCLSSAGERRLPYKYLVVKVGVRDEGLRDALRKVFENRAVVTSGIRRGLQELGCACPAPLRIDVSPVDETRSELTSGSYEYSGFVELPPPPLIRLTVKSGRADQAAYVLQKRAIYIGRNREIRNRDGGVIRRNDVVFQNSVVSRTHARIDFDDEMVRYRLFDNASRTGTTIFRENYSVAVPSGPAGGAWLYSGDEIHLGSAHLLVEIC